ncbi:MAG: efflux RND transporter permease subunit [Planctomycetia bacterium]|nr:efflux RND transporter permease subunit [Planctomycetia bacterium]
MKTLISWAVSNLPAMNILMITILLIGYWSMSGLNRETFPQFDLDQIMVSVSYPGATPEEVEESICQKIEEGVRDIRGIKKITSSAAENVGTVSIELLANVDDPNRVLNEVESAVGRIPSFPELCERPEVRLLQMEETIIRVGVLGPADWSMDAQLRLRDVAEKVRNDLLRYPVLSRIDIVGGKDYQIDVEMDENTLRSYGLTLQEVANILASENHQQAGGTIRGRSQEILLRSDTKQDSGEGIAKLPLLGVSEGATLTVGDLGTVRDEFVDVASNISIRTVLRDEEETAETVGQTRFSEDRPFLAVAVQRNPEEDLFAMIDAVRDYLKKAEVPQGYDLITWGDRSVEVRERLEMLAENGVQGLLIVFLCLTLFLDLRLSCWVALGIPFALLGTCFVVSALGQTLNLISSFAFIMGLGIVVDDAIVIGENVYTHRLQGKSTLQAAIDGTIEVFPSVFASVLTTIIAFMPLLFVAGMMGKMMYILPMVIISMLCFSLFESSTILPAHLSHKDNLIFRICRTVFYLFRWVIYLLQWMAGYAMAGMEWYIERIYRPSLTWVLHYRSIFVAACLGVLILSAGMIRGGVVPFVFFPRMDSTSIVCNVQFPNGTPEALTTYWAERLEEAYWRVSERIFQETGEQVSVHSIRTIGSNMSGRGMGGGMSGGDSSHMASVEIELVEATERSLESFKIVDMWREEAGEVPGALQLTFDSAFGGPGGKAIEFKLVAPAEYAHELEQAVERCKAKLATYEGVFDIRDDNIPGKWELQPKVKDFAVTQGIRQADIATVLRNAYYGAEVMRLQRGRHEVKLMVRYPEEARRSLASFEELRVRIDGVERPIGELADVTIKRGYSTINRIDQQRAITITADVDDTKISPNQVIQDLKGETRSNASVQQASIVSLTDQTAVKKVTSNGFLPDLMREFPHLNIRWEGQREQEEESFDSLKMGFSMALLAMFVLLAMEFKSYTQPMIILSVIPFAAVVVVVGHAIFGMQMTFMGVFGLIALAGIVINDAIVLVDFINKKVREQEMSITDACIEAGMRRFRPVFLTTLTTVGGLLPICFETSFQAKMIIPMAFTLAVGTAGATVVTLYLVPVLYSLYDQFAKYMTRRLQLEHD